MALKRRKTAKPKEVEERASDNSEEPKPEEAKATSPKEQAPPAEEPAPKAKPAQPKPSQVQRVAKVKPRPPPKGFEGVMDAQVFLVTHGIKMDVAAGFLHLVKKEGGSRRTKEQWKEAWDAYMSRPVL